MNLHLIDWLLVGTLLLCLIGITIYTKRYNRSIADFLAANRLAGRYLLTVSAGFGGAISLVAAWEVTYTNGLPAEWWGGLAAPVMLLIALTGFVIYRFRETRALTLAQFFEMRYSRRFRFFSGSLCWLSGILNFGIFPAVTARFIIYFCGLPQQFELFGVAISTFPVVMLCYLSIAVYIACAGGQISIMITDFVQGMLQMLIFLVVMFYLLWQFGWSDIMAGLMNAPEQQSMINPFKTAQASDFNIWYFMIGLIGTIYSTRAWQGSSGYNAAARTPHEAVMAGIIGTWRGFAAGLCMLLIPLAAYAILHSAKFADLAAPIQAQLAGITDPVIRSQMTIPVFLTHILPVGLTGLFAVIIIACAISCDDTYVHAWGSIFIQDIVMPLRGKPFAPDEHMKILRISIISVAAFGFVFSMLFPLKEFIFMYFAITGAIYLGGAGAVIIGGLYWKHGTTEAAWTAMIVGTALGLGGIAVQQLWPGYLAPWLAAEFPNWQWLVDHKAKFPINGQYIYLGTMLSASLSYLLVSLLGPRRVHNMDQLLHRNAYAAPGTASAVSEPLRPRLSLARLIGINENFTRGDRIIACCSAIWSFSWWGVTIIVSALALLTDWLTDEFWIELWWWKLLPASILLGTICTLWITAGGLRDIWRLFVDLRQDRIVENDDGFVADRQER